MPRRAWAYIFGVFVLALCIVRVSLWDETFATRSDWVGVAILLPLAACAQLFKVRVPYYQSYHVTLVFLLAGALLAPPPLYVLIVVIPHLLEWAKERWKKSPRLRNWYLQPFNIATHIIAGLLAAGVFHAMNREGAGNLSVSAVIAVFVATLIYLFLNHLLIGVAITLGRGVSLRQSGILDLANLQKDWVLLLIGSAVAILWTMNPWWTLVFSPIALAYYALAFQVRGVPVRN